MWFHHLDLNFQPIIYLQVGRQKLLSRSLFYCNFFKFLLKKKKENMGTECVSPRAKNNKEVNCSKTKGFEKSLLHCTPHYNGGQGCVSAWAPLPRLSHSHTLPLSLWQKRSPKSNYIHQGDVHDVTLIPIVKQMGAEIFPLVILAHWDAVGRHTRRENTRILEDEGWGGGVSYSLSNFI